MKKVVFLSVLLSSFIALGAYADVIYASDKNNTGDSDVSAAGVLCNHKKTRCTVGKFVMQGTINHPLYVRDGIVCNYKRTQCTNGYSMQRSQKPQY